jgi:hypothetical protein
MMKEMRRGSPLLSFLKVGDACIQGYDPEEFQKLLEGK